MQAAGSVLWRTTACDPVLKKCKPFLLSELQIAPIYSILKAFPSILYRAILGFGRSRGVFTILFPSSIGWIHCCEEHGLSSFFDAFPPGISPFLIVEFNSLAFPTRKMYSVNPFGNGTLSCNVGSIAFSPECPWISRRYRHWLEEELRIQAILKPFLSSSSFCQSWLISILQVTTAKHHLSSSSCTLRWCHCSGVLRDWLVML